MKKSIILFASLIITSVVFAQSPQKMSYQSVIRNATNDLVTESTVGVQISIMQGTPVGTAVYVETHAPVTNINGLASLEIGMGTPLTGTFEAIDWSAGPYFIRTDTDPLGGIAYSLTGTTELLSVPYALYAVNAGSAGSWTVTADAVHTDMEVGIGTETPTAQLHVFDDVGENTASIFGENTVEGNFDYNGVRGRSINAPGWGIGGIFEGGSRGVYATAFSSTFSGTTAGLHTIATGSAGSRRGVQAVASNPGGLTAYGLYGSGSGATTNYGVYGEASGGAANWAGYFLGKVRVTSSTDVSSETPSAQLYVFDDVGENGASIFGENTVEGNFDYIGVKGRSINAPGWGIGGIFEGGSRGVYATAFSSTFSGTTAGLHAIATGTAGGRRGVQGVAFNPGGVSGYGLYGRATGGATTNYGVYAEASGGSTNWAGYFSGDVRITGTLDNTSDARLKKDIEDLENALEIIKRLEPKTYQFRTDEFPQMALDKRSQLGFIAQDMEKVLPQLVRSAIHPGSQKDGREESDIPDSPDVDVMSINYIGIIPVLTQGIKELASEVEALASVIKAKDQANKELRVQVAQLEYKLESVDAMVIRMEQIEKELQRLRK